MTVTGWETDTFIGESVYRIGPTAKAETHRAWGTAGLSVYVGPKSGPERDSVPQRQKLSLTVEEAELLALALFETVGRITANGEEQQ